MSRKLFFIITFWILASCSTKRTYGGSFRKAYSDRACNHSHICCQMDCPCCFEMLNKKQKKKLSRSKKNEINLKNRIIINN